MVYNSTNINKQTKTTMTLEIQVMAWDRHKNVTGLKQLLGGGVGDGGLSNINFILKFVKPLALILALIHVSTISVLISNFKFFQSH